MSRFSRSVVAPVGVAVLLSVAVACSSGGDDSGGGDSLAPTTVAADATTTVDTAAPDTSTAATDAPTTVPATPWRDDAATALSEVLGATQGTGNELEIAQRWFALPVAVAVPDDAVLSGALVRATVNDDGTVRIRWDVRFASATAAAADMEAAVTSGFSDPRFAAGVRVVSQLDDGEFVTLNYTTTEAGVAEGWDTLSFSVGPETDIDGPTGKQRLAVNAERTAATLADLDLPSFLTAWVAQFPPLPDGAKFFELEADLVDLSTRGIWITSRATAPADRYASLVEYYSKDWTSGDLEYGQSSVPTDLATNDYFTAGSFPKLAGYGVWVTTTRSLSNPDEPARVEYQVRLEEPAG